MDFKEKVFLVVKKIPKGKVLTYKKVAKFIGLSNSARAVGNALNKNTDFKNIPCHRVVCSNGYVGGYVFGFNKKRKLLIKEGVIIINNKIDLKKFLFK
ncbi:MAG TPA: MGMT family protein [archaeon]|nr:MGMT family protein [archaeon]